jgi:DeoR/GlpR family transcriptional regulator of sugar metabolism
MRVFARERQEWVLAELRKAGRVEVAQLAEALNVSEDTVRRDLRALAAAGHLQKTHGGAVALDPARMSWATRADVAGQAKAAIADAAAALLEPNHTAMLDAGSTVLALAHALVGEHELRPLTIVTNSLDVALALDGEAGVTLVLSGGQWDPRSRYLVGPGAVAGIGRYRADWAFLGACALHPLVGATSVDALDAEVKRTMAATSLRVAVLADSTKYQTTATHAVCGPDDIDVLVTDAAADAEQWNDTPVRVLVAPALGATAGGRSTSTRTA